MCRNRKLKESCFRAYLKRDRTGQRRIDLLYKDPGYFENINTKGYSYNE